jgi:outer membrane receptor protein involved in Fe transport
MGLPSLLTGYNLGKVRNKGLELSADAQFSRYLSGYANYSWQAQPKGKDVANLAPTHRFNAGLDFDYQRYLGRVSAGYVGSSYWNDIVGYGGPTKA